MMAVMPGVHFLNAVQGTAMARYDIVCVHTIVGHPPANAAHFSTRADGYIWQSRDTRYRSAANYNGNPRVIAIENEDMGPAYGVWNTNDGHAVPGFTAAQVEAIAQICAWANRTHGIPLSLCPDSKPGSRGIAYHRQGIDGNWAGFAYGGRVAGGEVWTTTPGKVCPGDRRITQVITQIIPRARQIAGLEQDMQADERAWLAALHEAVISGFNWPGHKDNQIYKVLGDVATRAVDAATAAGARADAAGAKVDALAGTIASAAREAVATYLTANPPTVAIDYTALAKAVNDDADARARDNNPDTGPRS
jgi:hypothetical protein